MLSDRRTVAFWGISSAGEPLTDQQMEDIVSALCLGAGAANIEFAPCTCALRGMATGVSD